MRTQHLTSWQKPFLTGLVAAALAACSMPAPQVATVDQGRALEEASPAPAAVSSAASAKMAAPRAARAESTLGTQWGEGRESVTQSVQASRLTPNQARDLGQMRYTDEASIRRALGGGADRQLNALLAGGDVEWQVSNGSGTVWPIFSRPGARDYYLAGRSGERYELVYTNRSARYYEVVATVDGLDVLTGQPGSVGNDGYLLRPGERLVIDGFRKSDREVAAFRFSAKGRAYANNTPTGDARNVGVIGTALFEVRLDQPDLAMPRRSTAPAAGEPQAFPADPAPRSFAPPPQYRR